MGSAATRMKPERVLQAIGRLAKEQRLRNICAVEVEEGFVVQGLTRRSKGKIAYLVYKTQLLSYEELERLASGL